LNPQRSSVSADGIGLGPEQYFASKSRIGFSWERCSEAEEGSGVIRLRLFVPKVGTELPQERYFEAKSRIELTLSSFQEAKDRIGSNQEPSADNEIIRGTRNSRGWKAFFCVLQPPLVQWLVTEL
jgi:hypothetical protein